MGSEPACLRRFEWPTAALIAGIYVSWLALNIYATALNPVIWIIATALVLTLFWSITHEVVHNHPTHNALINRLMVILPIGFVFPYERFRDTHVQHHQTGDLTDPFDDPESWYLAQTHWQKSNAVLRGILTFNNTLFGRMLIGPVITLWRFYVSEIELFVTRPDLRFYLARVWAGHLLLCGLIGWMLAMMNSAATWMHFAAIYLSLSLLLIRTFLEHQAAEDQSERTVIIEQCCPIAFLFLFNNLHVVHHANPGIAWYRLPAHYRQNREHYRNMNGNYVYGSYSEIIRLYFFRPKEAVAHPIVIGRS